MKQSASALGNGELIILFDDLETNSGALVGLAEKVSAVDVNLMTKIGQGLIYVCIDEKTAHRLQLPLMVENNTNSRKKNFTASVDYKTTTTGISAFERADTIKAITNRHTVPSDFKRPGHIFPIISKKNGLLDRIDVVEASIDLAKKTAHNPTTFLCEILNDRGSMSTRQEVEELARAYHIPFIPISTLLEEQQKNRICTLSGSVIKGRQLGRTIGFPTANLAIEQKDVSLHRGVYGVKVKYKDKEYEGIMNVGVRPSFDDSGVDVHHEVHILNFDQFIYGETLTVEVCFFIREEKAFPYLEKLITQIRSDAAYVETRFGLIHKVSV
ncbi:3,4-dihydroxy-2-butanone-4-phosphate synthase [Pseudalkalibacillus sp. A8]|uniref:3,4-dihydroxy-2-butanone-4-phosphate synthase n=1 Tax=Pseudalkalibacillus sp. A8 TaxID=3382641 RepID=UPI0038B616D2